MLWPLQSLDFNKLEHWGNVHLTVLSSTIIKTPHDKYLLKNDDQLATQHVTETHC